MKETTRIIAAWRVIDKYGEVERFGIDDFPTEFDLDQLPDGWSGDRPIHKVAKEMSKRPLWKVNQVRTFFVFRDNNDTIRTPEQVRLEGGVCRDITVLYASVFKKLGWYQYTFLYTDLKNDLFDFTE